MLKKSFWAKSKHLRNPALYIMHHGARYLFPLVVTPFYAHKFGPSYFADFVIWNSCVWTASLFMEYGFFLYAVSETAVADTPDKLSRALSKIVSAKLTLLPIALLIYAALTVSLGVAARHPAAALIGVIAMISYGGSFAWYFQGQQRAGTAVSVEAFPQLAQFLLIFLFVHSAKDLWVATLLQTLAAAGTIAVSCFLIARDRPIIRLALHGVRDAMKGAAPFFIERLCLTLYQSATPLFISAFSFREQAAFYSVGDKFLQFLGGLSIPLSYAMLPVISKHMSSDKADWKLSARVVGLVSVVTCILALISFLGARFVILLLFKPEYAAAIPVAQCFCFAACFVSYNACIANFVLVPSGRARILIVTSITATALSLGSQAVLLPRFGALGSAASRAIAEVAVAIILTVVASRIIQAKWPLQPAAGHT